ncbi:MAG: replication-relaxation family protein [Streptosporangiaceae bacterium]
MLAASAHLTERDRYLVRMVGEQRVLTTGQLCALGFGNVTTARHRLAVLARLGVLRRFRPHREQGSAPWHYLLGPVGAVLLGAEDRDARGWAPRVRADRQLALERSQRLSHLIGVNWFFVALAACARAGGELRMWLAEAEAAAYHDQFVPALSRGQGPRPDGLGSWAEDGREVTFFLEHDTGTEHLPRLEAKLPGYARLAEALAQYGRACPVLLFAFPGPRREQSARAVLGSSADAPALRIATTAADPRLTCPAGPVWLPLAGTGAGQLRLIDLERALPDPWQLARQQAERELAARRTAQHVSQDFDLLDDDLFEQ